MLKRFFARPRTDSVPQELYGRVVAQARRPGFYEAAGVPDTVAGRFDMLCLHMFLLTRRLALESDALAKPLSQDLFDAFTADLDSALRELGVGDTSIAKRMKRMLGSYYALIAGIGPALDAGDARAAGEAAATRFSAGHLGAAGFFAAYLQASQAALTAKSFAELARGELDWPEPQEARGA